MRYTMQRSGRSNRVYALRWQGTECTGVAGPLNDIIMHGVISIPSYLSTLDYDTEDGRYADKALWESPIVAYDDDQGELPAAPTYRQLFTGDYATMETVQRAIDAAVPHITPIDCTILLTRDPSMAGWSIVGHPPTPAAMARIERAAFDIAERTSR